MPSPRSPSATRAVGAVAAAALALALSGAPHAANASGRPGSGTHQRHDAHDDGRRAERAHLRSDRPSAEDDGWSWPVEGARVVVRGFEAPSTRYSAGHRGIDVPAAPGTSVLAPQDGVVRFAGVVVDRATITIETTQGVLISMEPVASPLVRGDPAHKGGQVGAVAAGGHCDRGCLHLGVRVHGDYVSPLRFFGGVRRAVLLPIR